MNTTDFFAQIFTEGSTQGKVALTCVVLVATIALCSTSLFTSRRSNGKPPLVGFRSWLEPDFLVRLRFYLGAQSMIAGGYKKFSSSVFRLARSDRDVVVISSRYVDELSMLPSQRLNPREALLNNMVAKYSATSAVIGSNIHFQVLQNKLTPSLPSLRSVVKNELDFAAAKMHGTVDWTKVEIYNIILQLVSQITARVCIGGSGSLCRDAKWLQNCLDFTKNATLTVMILRGVPRWMHPLVARMLPMYWKTQKAVQRAKDMLVPIIELRRMEQVGSKASERPQDMLQWMMDAAEAGEDFNAGMLAHRQLIMCLASIHTTTMATAHIMHDLCTHPEYIDILREEMQQVIEQSGPGVPEPDKLRKLDSFMKESQRINPISLLNFYRMVQTPITLKGGVILQPGDQICAPAFEISQDPVNIPNPEFDGLRYYKLRHDSWNDKKYQYVTTDQNHLHFGHGRFACPGRFFAVSEIKLILMKLLLEYDFRFENGQHRPKNINADEFLFVNPKATVLMRKRIVANISTRAGSY